MANNTSIYIGENSLRLINAGLNGNKFEISALAFRDELPPLYTIMNDKTMSDAAKVIEESFNTMKVSSKNVNVIIPDTYTFSQIQEMPKLKEKELLSAIRYQADQFIPLPLEEASLDLEVLYEDPTENKLLVLIVAASEKLITQVSNIIELAGLIPNSVENELSAIGRYISTSYKPTNSIKDTKAANSASVFLNIGNTTSSLYLYDHTRSLVKDSYNIKIGIDLFIRELKANMNLDNIKAMEALKTIGVVPAAQTQVSDVIAPAVEDLLKEIEKFVIAMKEKYKLSIENIFLCNNAYIIHSLDQKIKIYTGINSTVYDISSMLTRNKVIETIPPLQLSSFIGALGGCIR
jgi:type IV pilus assembly protein PilM